jgi:hypothetical protein
VCDVLVSVSVVLAAVACAVALVVVSQLRHARLQQAVSDHCLAALGAELVRLREALARIGRLAEESAARDTRGEHFLAQRLLDLRQIAADAQAALRDGAASQ